MDSIEAECRKLQFDLNIIISDNQFVETIHSIDFFIIYWHDRSSYRTGLESL